MKIGVLSSHVRWVYNMKFKTASLCHTVLNNYIYNYILLYAILKVMFQVFLGNHKIQHQHLVKKCTKKIFHEILKL
jgi:hypothetical protein